MYFVFSCFFSTLRHLVISFRVRSSWPSYVVEFFIDERAHGLNSSLFIMARRREFQVFGGDQSCPQVFHGFVVQLSVWRTCFSKVLHVCAPYIVMDYPFFLAGAR